MNNYTNNNERWGQSILMLLIVFLCFSILYFDAFLSIWNEWFSEGSAYSHGPLVFGVSLYLVWLKRHEISPIPSSSSTLMASLFLLASIPVWVVASALSIETLKHVFIIVMLAILIFGVMGWRITFALMFPLGYLFFAVPIWAVLEPGMQHITAWSSGVILSVIGIPVLVDGLFLSIPEGVFEVEGGCSGVNYLISGLALSLFYSYISYRSYWKRAAFIVSAVILTIIGNIIRVVIIIIAGHLTDMQHAFIEDHSTMGWWVFILIMIPLYIVGFRYQEPEPAIWHAGNKGQGRPVFRLNSKAVILLTPLIVVLALGPLAASLVNKSMGHDLVEGRSVEFNARSDSWSYAKIRGLDTWSPAFPRGDVEMFQGYNGLDSSVAFAHVTYYARQDREKELAGGANSIVDDAGWFSMRNFASRVVDSGASPSKVREEYIVEKNGRKQFLVWYWYSVAGHVTTQRRSAKLLEFYKLIGSNKGSALIVVASEVVGGDVKQARYRLSEFHRDISPELQSYVNQLGSHQMSVGLQ